MEEGKVSPPVLEGDCGRLGGRARCNAVGRGRGAGPEGPHTPGRPGRPRFELGYVRGAK